MRVGHEVVGQAHDLLALTPGGRVLDVVQEVKGRHRAVLQPVLVVSVPRTLTQACEHSQGGTAHSQGGNGHSQGGIGHSQGGTRHSHTHRVVPGTHREDVGVYQRG